ncbi:MAG: MoaD family protein [Thermodesulfobacteriota bacterium]
MKINVEFLGLPMISNVIGKKKLELDISGNRVKDVLEELIQRYGKKVREALYDPQGNFDSMIQVSLNGKTILSPDQHDTPLKEGDSLLLMLLLAGG